jgi:hypothetical protein
MIKEIIGKVESPDPAKSQKTSIQPWDYGISSYIC